MIYAVIGLIEGIFFGFFFLLIEALNDDRNYEGRERRKRK